MKFFKTGSGGTHVAAPVFALLAILYAPNPSALAHPLAQGRIEVRVEVRRITLKISVAAEEIIIRQAIPSGDDDSFQIAPDACKKHGDYLLQHVILNADGKRLEGKVVRIDEPGERSIHVLNVAGLFTAYEIEFELPLRATAFELSENVLNELDYSPGNRWEVSYMTSVRIDGKTVLENRIVSSSTPLTFSSAALNKHSEPPPFPSSSGGDPTSNGAARAAKKSRQHPKNEPVSVTHNVAIIMAILSVLILIAVRLQKRPY